MTDSEVRNLLPAYMESDLTPEQMREVEAHLAVSSECREELDYLKRIQRLIAGSPESAAPGLWRSIARQIVVADVAEPWKQFEWVGKRFLPIVAAAVVLLAVLGNLSGEAPAFTLEDYMKVQWADADVAMLSPNEPSRDDILQILQTR